MFNRKKTYLGLDIGAGGIKLVELRRQKKRPVLFTYGMSLEKYDVHELTEHQLLNTNKKLTGNLFKLEQNDLPPPAAPINQPIDELKVEDYANKIKFLCQASRVTAKTAVVSLPVSSVFHAVVTLPITKRPEELKQLIKSEIKKFIPVPLEEMALDYQILSNNLFNNQAKTQKILVNAVPNALITFYSKVFQKSGLGLDALEPESTALVRSLIGRDKTVTMLIDIGAGRTNFFIVDQAIPITHQSIDFGGHKVDRILQNILGLEAGQVEQVKNNLFIYFSASNRGRQLSAQQLLNIFMPVIDPIVKEIEVSLELYLRQAGNINKRPEKVILTGGTAFLPYLSAYIADKFKLKCYIGDPWSRVVYQQALKPVLHEIGPQMSVAIGLALRNMV